MIHLVTSARNPVLKRLRSLREKKYRRQEGLVLAEGLRILADALSAGWIPEILLFAEGKEGHPLVHRLLQATLGEGGMAVATTPALLAAVSGKDNPQMVLAAYRERPLQLQDVKPGRRTLVAERLRDPGNLGTLLRACDGTATDLLVLVDECTDASSVEAVRASMGAYFTVRHVHTTTADFLAWRKRHGATLVAAALDAAAIPYRAAAYPPPTLLLVGNEAQGLPPVLLAAADQRVIMPMRGRADSLNVAMAGTLLLYEALHAQDEAQDKARHEAPNRRR